MTDDGPAWPLADDDDRPSFMGEPWPYIQDMPTLDLAWDWFMEHGSAIFGSVPGLGVPHPIVGLLDKGPIADNADFSRLFDGAITAYREAREQTKTTQQVRESSVGEPFLNCPVCGDEVVDSPDAIGFTTNDGAVNLTFCSPEHLVKWLQRK